MKRKYIYILLVACWLGGISISCTEDIPACPSKMCVVAGGWQLTEVYIDDVKDNSDLSLYRLVLIEPAPVTATTSGFTRVQPSGGTDQGSWSIINGESILRLIPNDDPVFTEDWIIETFTPRQLVLVINRDTGIKQGPSKIRFVLEPI
ncbi:MAG: hypothetical protein ACOYXT_22280 [Bacteroidota bacterium]